MDTTNTMNYENKDNQEETWKKSKSFFDYIAVLKLSDEDKESVANTVLDWMYADKLFFIQLALSVIIATLWLLINSTAVVIWAMLIAPIMRPIQWIAFSISAGNNGLYVRGLQLLFWSIVISILIATILSFLIPFTTLTSEILARTSPTIIDLMIALASWTIAILALWFHKLSESIAWVAMAASLVPPLCVTGVWLALFDLDVARWSFLLFLANLIAIIAVWVLIFYTYWFFPTNKSWQNKSIFQIFMIVLSISLVVFPLFSWFQSIIADVTIKWWIEMVFDQQLKNLDNKAYLVDYNYLIEWSIVGIDATIRISEKVNVTNDMKAMIIQSLANQINKPVSLSLNIIPIRSVFIPTIVSWGLQDTIAPEFLIPDMTTNELDENVLVVKSNFELKIENGFEEYFSWSTLENYNYEIKQKIHRLIDNDSNWTKVELLPYLQVNIKMSSDLDDSQMQSRIKKWDESLSQDIWVDIDIVLEVRKYERIQISSN